MGFRWAQGLSCEPSKSTVGAMGPQGRTDHGALGCDCGSKRARMRGCVGGRGNVTIRARFHGPPGVPGACHGLDGPTWRFRGGSSLWPPHSGFAELEALEAAQDPPN